MNIYLIVLVVVLLAFVLIALNMAMRSHDVPHPHHDLEGGKDAGAPGDAAPGKGEGEERNG